MKPDNKSCLLYPVKIPAHQKAVFHSVEELFARAREIAALETSTYFITRQTRVRLIATAEDLLALAAPLISAWQGSLADSIKSFDTGFEGFKREQDVAVSAHTPDSGQLLAALIKSYLFLLRSMHDAIYGALYEMITHQGAGEKLSMYEKCIQKRDKSPVYRYLSKSHPEYESWFLTLRAIRNQIKYGRITSVRSRHSIEYTDVFIQFRALAMGDNGGAVYKIVREIGMSDVICDLDITTKLLLGILLECKNENKA